VSRVRLIVLQHEQETRLGAFRHLLDAAHADYEVVTTASAPLPSADRFDGALVLGGSLNAYDPRLLETRRWIRNNVLRGLPFLGVCLGSQLLASALGGVVAPLPAPEVGLHDVILTEDARRDQLFADLPDRFPVFGWHEDSFSLPPGAIPLAGSPACTHQAFRFGDAAYGLQFHPELRACDLARWRGNSAYREVAANAAKDWESLLAALEEATPTLDALARHLLGRWLGIVAARAALQVPQVRTAA
jgi:GMP synthase-like glutamine amidotransferase